MAKTGILQFFREVRSEVKKVTWPSRKETTISAIAVFVMVSVMALFLYFVDQIIAYTIRLIMGF